MGSEGSHGIFVDVEEVRGPLERTRMLRLGLAVVWEHLPQDMETGPIADALWKIHERLCDAELRELRQSLPGAYVVVSPINPMKPPGPEDMKAIARAIRTLDDLGLIVVP